VDIKYFDRLLTLMHVKSSGAGLGKNSDKTISSIDAFNRGEI